MAKQDVDKKHVKISVPPPLDSALKQVDDVFIVITQAYCPKGHALITEDNDDFDGYPGIKVHIRRGATSEDLILSPFHGDNTRKGNVLWSEGEKVEICCPICHAKFPRMASCRCDGDGELVKFYTTPTLRDSNVVAMCNVWGCPLSRTINNWQMISEFLDGRIED